MDSGNKADRVVDFTLDGVSFRLQEQHDFGWLRSLGRVFKVFDRQDSGNICFGVEKHGRKCFVKYAGAKPTEFSGDPRDAAARLSEAVPLYSALKHPQLIRLQDHFPTPDGCAAVFEWFEGECLHPHWSFSVLHSGFRTWGLCRPLDHRDTSES